MLTTKIGGKAVGTDEIGVSEDGKTLSMTVHVPVASPRGRPTPGDCQPPHAGYNPQVGGALD
jgi:hypothetical protein